MNIVNVAVMAPILGADLSYLTDVDGRVRALDANGAIGDGRHALPGQVLTPDRVNDILAVADVLLVGYPVPARLAGRAPRLAWAHHTQAGVSNLVGSDLWTSPVTLTTSRGVVGATAIAEYVMAAASHFARGLQEGARQKQNGVFTTDGYELISLRGATMGVLGLGGIGQEVARLSRAVGMRVIAPAGPPAPPRPTPTAPTSFCPPIRSSGWPPRATFSPSAPSSPPRPAAWSATGSSRR